MRRVTIITLIAAGMAQAAVWVGYEGGLRRYSDEGEHVRTYDNYRRPISLALDVERRRLWFLASWLSFQLRRHSRRRLSCSGVPTQTGVSA